MLELKNAENRHSFDVLRHRLSKYHCYTWLHYFKLLIVNESILVVSFKTNEKYTLILIVTQLIAADRSRLYPKRRDVP